MLECEWSFDTNFLMFLTSEVTKFVCSIKMFCMLVS